MSKVTKSRYSVGENVPLSDFHSFRHSNIKIEVNLIPLMIKLPIKPYQAENRGFCSWPGSAGHFCQVRTKFRVKHSKLPHQDTSNQAEVVNFETFSFFSDLKPRTWSEYIK